MKIIALFLMLATSLGCAQSRAVFSDGVTSTNDGKYNAANSAGADIGAKINATFSACGNACHVYVPAGSYSFSTTINFPVISLGQARLEFDPAAYLYYSGSGYAINLVGSGQSMVNAVIEGGRLQGTLVALGGIHNYAFNGAIVRNMVIHDFGGAGILNEGANTVTIENVVLGGNQDGIRNVGVAALAMTANAIRVIGGYINNNTRYAIFDDASGGVNIGNQYTTTIEGRGIFIQGGAGIGVANSYFETAGVTQPNIIIGDMTHQPTGTVIANSAFSTSGATSTISNVSGQSTLVVGCIEGGVVTNFVLNGALARSLAVYSPRAVSATNLIGGFDSGNDNVLFTSRLTLGGVVAKAPTPTVTAGQVGFGTTTSTTVGASGTAATLPLKPKGYLVVNIGGTNYKIPYYN